MGEVLEFIIELVIELIVDGGIELTKSKKVSKWIRYPIVAIAGIVTIGIFGFMFLVGYGLLEETVFGGLIILGFTILLLILTIHKLIKVYKEAKEVNFIRFCLLLRVDHSVEEREQIWNIFK